MVDFTKLNDPEHMARVRASIAADDERREELDAAVLRTLNLCRDHEHALNERERSFVRSARAAVNSYRSLTQPQMKWLGDIGERLSDRVGFIAVTSGMRGYFAVHMRVDESGCPGPECSGPGSYGSPDGAQREAREWAQSECIPYTYEGVDLPKTLKQVLAARSGADAQPAVAPPAAAASTDKSPGAAGDVAQPVGLERGRAVIAAARARARGPR